MRLFVSTTVRDRFDKDLLCERHFIGKVVTVLSISTVLCMMIYLFVVTRYGFIKQKSILVAHETKKPFDYMTKPCLILYGKYSADLRDSDVIARIMPI